MLDIFLGSSLLIDRYYKNVDVVSTEIPNKERRREELDFILVAWRS